MSIFFIIYKICVLFLPFARGTDFNGGGGFDFYFKSSSKNNYIYN